MTSRRACAQLPFRSTHTHTLRPAPAPDLVTHKWRIHFVLCHVSGFRRLIVLLLRRPHDWCVWSAHSANASDVTNIESDPMQSFGGSPPAYHPSTRSVNIRRSFWIVDLVVFVLTNVDFETVDQMTVSTEQPNRIHFSASANKEENHENERWPTRLWDILVFRAAIFGRANSIFTLQLVTMAARNDPSGTGIHRDGMKSFVLAPAYDSIMFHRNGRLVDDGLESYLQHRLEGRCTSLFLFGHRTWMSSFLCFLFCFFCFSLKISILMRCFKMFIEIITITARLLRCL